MERPRLIIKLKSDIVPEEAFTKNQLTEIGIQYTPKIDRLFDFARNIDKRNFNKGYELLDNNTDLDNIKDIDKDSQILLSETDQDFYKILSVDFENEEDAKNAITFLRDSDKIEYVEKDIKFILPIYTKDEELDTTANWGLEHIGVPNLHKQNINGNAVIVATLDTGIDFENTDLKSKILIPKSENSSNFIKNNSDHEGHGTHVAGIIASGKYGVAPECKILPLKVIYKSNETVFSGYTWYSMILKSMKYAIDNGASIINNSWEPPNGENLDPMEYSMRALNELFIDAEKKGVIIVFAAGNFNKDISKYIPNNAKNVITVAAINKDNNKITISNFGKEVDLAAPGFNIVSYSLDNKTAVLSGTSMAAPHVSGLAALIIGNSGKTNRPLLLNHIATHGVDLTKTNIGFGINAEKCFKNLIAIIS